MLLTGGDNKILRRIMLQNHPHTFHIVLCVAPVAQGIQVSELQLILQTARDSAGSQGNLSGDKVFAAAFGFVVKQDAVDRKHAIGLPILLGDPKAVLLCNGIGTVWVKRRQLVLRNLLNLAVKLRGGCLINFAGLGKAQNPHSLQNTEDTDCVHVSGIFWHVKADLYVALRGKIIDFVRLYLADNADERGGVGKVSVVQGNGVLFQ